MILGDMLTVFWRYLIAFPCVKSANKEAHFSYLEIVNLSLAFFNLLPLPNLDGESLLDCFGTVLESRRRSDMEALEFDLNDDDLSERHGPKRFARLISGIVKTGTILVVIVFVSLSAWTVIVIR
jgi:membrane-associated protease RseP (regulator of RpoE activity)